MPAGAATMPLKKMAKKAELWVDAAWAGKFFWHMLWTGIDQQF